MSRVIDTNAYLDTVCQLLKEGQSGVPVPIKGVSMRPFLRDGDMVYLDAITKPVKPGDIILFVRPNGHYVLHRVYRVYPDGGMLFLGDSELYPEPVAQRQLRAIVRCAACGETTVTPGNFRWWFYEKPWRWLAPVRKQISWVRNLLRKKA